MAQTVATLLEMTLLVLCGYCFFRLFTLQDPDGSVRVPAEAAAPWLKMRRRQYSSGASASITFIVLLIAETGAPFSPHTLDVPIILVVLALVGATAEMIRAIVLGRRATAIERPFRPGPAYARTTTTAFLLDPVSDADGRAAAAPRSETPAAD